MARLSTYAIDGTPVSSDKLIGTDDSGVATKNYPLGTVAAWLKESGATAILGQNNFIFQTEVDPQVGRLPGTFSLPVVGGDGTPFSDITTLKFSITSSAGQYVVDYIASTVGSKVILGQLDDLNAFGVYALESFTQDPEAPTFYNAVLSLASGNGSLISAKSYGFATYSSSATSGGTWGGITGTITNQTDLVDYIDAEIAAIPTPATPTLQSVTDAGNTTTNSIGIGTATPGYPLHIVTSNNSTVLGLDAGSAARFRFAGNSTSGYTSTFNIDDTGLDIGHDSTARSLNLKTGNQDRLTILGAGNVGIGTTAPAQVLHINKDNPYIQIQDSSAPTRGDMSAGIIMKDSTGAQSFQITQSNSVDVSIRANAGDLSLGTFVGTVIKLDGSKVGIGNTAPDEKLRVEGNIKSAGDFIGSAVKLGFAGTANITTYDTNEDLLINPNGSGNILMQTTSGNVGIGTTAPSEKLHVDGNVLIENNLHVKGDVTIGKISNDSALVDVGGNFNFDTVSEPGASDTANFTATIQNVAGNINNGSHTYTVIYKTADGGETGAYNLTYFKTITITDNTTAGQVLLTGIPVSTDARVVARDIYRTSANDSPYYGKKLATINDNTTTTYTDNLPDSSLDQNTMFYRKADTTAGVFYIDNFIIAQAPNHHKTSFGQDALRNNTIGQDNVAIGGYSLSAITNGKQNTAIGYSSGSNSVDGQNNTFLGYVAGYYNDSGDWNTYVGSFAGRNADVSSTNYNTGVGGGSLYKLTTNNSWNTALGYYSGNGAQGQWNIHLGYWAGYKSTPAAIGNFNINIGAYTGQYTAGTGNILIGRQIDAVYTSSSNQLNIGNLIYGDGLGNGTNQATGNVGISSTTPSSKLSINGTAMSQFRLEVPGGPSSNTDTSGIEGDFAYDDQYLYVKTGSGWGRVALDFAF